MPSPSWTALYDQVVLETHPRRSSRTRCKLAVRQYTNTVRREDNRTVLGQSLRPEEQEEIEGALNVLFTLI